MALADLFRVTEPGALEQVETPLLEAFLQREGGSFLVPQNRLGEVGVDAGWLRQQLRNADDSFPLRLADALTHVEDLTERLASCGDPAALERAIRLWMRDSSRVRALLSEPVRMYRRAARPRTERRVGVGGSEWRSGMVTALAS